MAEPEPEVKEPPKAKKASAVGNKKLTQTEAAEVAEGLLDLGGYVVAKIVENDEAEFTDDEKDDILPGLTRIMLRMSPAAANRFRTMTDPFTLMLAFYFYAARVMPMYQEKRWRDAYRRAQYAEQYGSGSPGVDQSVSDMDNGQPPQNPKNRTDRRGGILR